MAHRAEAVKNWGSEASSCNAWELGVDVEGVVVSGETVDMSLLVRDVLFNHEVWRAIRNFDHEFCARCATVFKATGADRETATDKSIHDSADTLSIGHAAWRRQLPLCKRTYL